MNVIGKLVTAYGGPAFVMCDARCEKAFGIRKRPRVTLSNDANDYAMLADHEVGIAPTDPGTAEGLDSKPQHPDDRLNKWCFRECERSAWAGHREVGELIVLPDWSQRQRNKPKVARA